MDAIQLTVAEIRAKAAELRESFGDDARARSLEWAASRIERALRSDDDQQLTLSEAALRSGYSTDHLARLIRDGRLPNAGRRGSPRIRVADLPIRPRPTVAGASRDIYDPIADARAIGSRR
ncbi:MAG: hypothetical protein ABJF01_25830 [bacterium]